MSPQDNSVRRYDLDWLRILATLLLIPYHTALIFNSCSRVGCFYIENETTSFGLEEFIRFVNMWFMPLFFLIAGASAKYSLDSRTNKEYCLERFKRLFIPLIFGIFILIPPMGYFAFLNHHQNSQLSYFQYYPLFFHINFDRIDGFTGTFTPAHLWFILYLFCYSLITIPLFQYLKNGDSIATLADYLSRQPTAIFLFAIPLTLARMTAIVYYNPIYYLLFFTLGYVLLLDKRFEESIEKINPVALSIALLGMLFYLSTQINEYNLISEFSFINIPMQLLLSLNSLAWVIVILSFARNKLKFELPLLAYFNQASYPIYILHMTFILPIAFYAVQWQVGIILKFLFISINSAISIFFVYSILISQFNLTRFILGMKLKS